jgi:hypothetical protein
MAEPETTFDHDDGRRGGRHDDRIEIDGKRKNAAVHKLCNGERGSSPHLTRRAWLEARKEEMSTVVTLTSSIVNHSSPTARKVVKS